MVAIATRMNTSSSGSGLLKKAKRGAPAGTTTTKRKVTHAQSSSSSSRSQQQQQQQGKDWKQRLAAGTLAPLAALSMFLAPQPMVVDSSNVASLSFDGGYARAGLPASNPTKDGKAILRYALPINNKSPIRVVQKSMENVSEALRVPGVKFSEVNKSIKRSQAVVTNDKKRREIIAEVKSSERQRDVSAKLDDIAQMLEDFAVISENKDKQEVPIIQQKILQVVGEIEEEMVPGFPFEVPQDYSNLPQLKGRATLEMKMRVKDAAARSLDFDSFTLTMVVDGYNAPVTAGNFVDLVKRKFYDGMEIQRSDGFVVQTGDPSGPTEGFIDPTTGEMRRIPFEVMVDTDKTPLPVYEETLEELGRFNEQPRLPFNAYGTMAMARSEFEPNSGSSQFFFLLRDSELTPTGSNLLDGRYAVFGYVTEGKDFLEGLKVGDVIESVRVISGEENLVKNNNAPAAAAASPEEVVQVGAEE
jgi:cyclophilin family peptidyl-prolyl cis-trans isomerase